MILNVNYETEHCNGENENLKYRDTNEKMYVAIEPHLLSRAIMMACSLVKHRVVAGPLASRQPVKRILK